MPEFQNAAELEAHYKALKARLYARQIPAKPAFQVPPAEPVTQAPPVKKRKPRKSRAKPRQPELSVEIKAPPPELPARTRARRIIVPILRAYDITWEEIVCPARRHELMLPRKAIYESLHNAGFSMKQIGRFCHRDHTTILHYLKKWCGYKTTPRKNRYKVTL